MCLHIVGLFYIELYAFRYIFFIIYFSMVNHFFLTGHKKNPHPVKSEDKHVYLLKGEVNLFI